MSGQVGNSLKHVFSWRGSNKSIFFFKTKSLIWDTYRKFPKYSDTQKICCNHSKIWTMWLYHRVMSPNDADGMANSVDPDQTAPLGLLGSLRYPIFFLFTMKQDKHNSINFCLAQWLCWIRIFLWLKQSLLSLFNKGHTVIMFSEYWWSMWTMHG